MHPFRVLSFFISNFIVCWAGLGPNGEDLWCVTESCAHDRVITHRVPGINEGSVHLIFPQGHTLKPGTTYKFTGGTYGTDMGSVSTVWGWDNSFLEVSHDPSTGEERSCSCSAEVWKEGDDTWPVSVTYCHGPWSVRCPDNFIYTVRINTDCEYVYAQPVLFKAG
eukprot:Lankesteria_metandrocarpae@DN8341_c0_g1_i1.p1